MAKARSNPRRCAMTRHERTILGWCHEHGWGFIKRDDDRDVFIVHASNITSGPDGSLQRAAGPICVRADAQDRKEGGSALTPPPSSIPPATVLRGPRMAGLAR
jgi:cold shock CspA family protein